MQRFRSAKSGKAEYSSPDSSAPNHDPEKTNSNNDNIEEEANLQRQNTRSSHRKSPRWWRIYWFRGMFQDVKRRAPFYLSDWLDAWDYRVVPATVYMFFANLLPALAFSLDMFDRTQMSYGVNEVLLSTVLAAVVFSLFAAQPLTIVGVTGPITVFNYTVYDIMVPTGANYFAFMCVIGLWAMVMHWFLAISNSCNGLRYVTRFSCDTFGFYVAVIYIEKGVQVLIRQYSVGQASAYLSIMVSLLVLMVAYSCGIIGGSSLFHRYVRKFIEDYGTPLTIVFFTGFVHIGHMRGVDLQTLPTSRAFYPTADRGWYVNFWDIRKENVGTAFPFALILTILFWFDHNVSSLIAQGTEFPLRKPAGFHWDIFLLGVTTGVAGMLGIPFPNGLIPQAPFHTNSLCVTRQVRTQASHDCLPSDPDEPTQNFKTERVVDHVVEQRVSNLAQGCICVVFMTGPLLIVVGLIPQGVLAGLFFTMGTQALSGNGITLKASYLCSDRELTSGHALAKLERQWMIYIFVGCELFFFAAAFAITQTIAAIGFPIILLAPIPFRAMVMPRLFRKDELDALDAPTASPFTMSSVGGQYGDDEQPAPPGPGNSPGRQTADEGGREEDVAQGSTTGASRHEKPLDKGGGDPGSELRFKNREGLVSDEARHNMSMTMQSGQYDPWRL